VLNTTRSEKERIGQLATPLGKELEPADELGAGDIGAVAKLRETRAGDVLATKGSALRFPPLELPSPVMAFAYEPKTKGDEEKAINAIRRLEEEDPTLDVHRDAQTGEHIIAGLSQVHVEVIVDRMKSRFGAEIELHPPRVPYLETIRKPAKAHGRYKKQTGGRGQFGDCHIEIEPAEPGTGLEFIDAIKGGVIPNSFIPAVEKGIAEAMKGGVIAGYPLKDVTVRLVDGQHHSVDSSENAFKVAGSLAFKDAVQNADACLLEPIVKLTIAAPEDSVGDVIGDLNSRRGHPLGMEPKGSVTEIEAEVPMAEVLDYAPDLRAITGGRGDFEMEFERYEELPAHLAQKVIAEAKDAEEVSA
jgi:elongation factor G